MKLRFTPRAIAGIEEIADYVRAPNPGRRAGLRRTLHAKAPSHSVRGTRFRRTVSKARKRSRIAANKPGGSMP
jgi:plasmid stabilization system protein ParE